MSEKHDAATEHTMLPIRTMMLVPLTLITLVVGVTGGFYVTTQYSIPLGSVIIILGILVSIQGVSLFLRERRAVLERGRNE